MPEIQETNVVVAVIEQNNQLLLGWRHAGLEQGNCYEFPGGKFEPGETAEQALCRELDEELGIRPLRFHPLKRIYHTYPNRRVCLWVFYVDEFAGTPYGREGQPVEWVPVEQLHQRVFPEANAPIVRLLQTPRLYAVTPALSLPVVTSLEGIISQPCTPLVYLRQPLWNAEDYFRYLGALGPEQAGYRWIIPWSVYHKLTADQCQQLHDLNILHGIHLRHQELFAENMPSVWPESLMVFASCHDLQSARQAEKLNCDAITMGPVEETSSHPEATLLGWPDFADISSKVWLPVYALGGQHPDNLQQARAYGAFGVSGISHFWRKEAEQAPAAGQ